MNSLYLQGSRFIGLKPVSKCNSLLNFKLLEVYLFNVTGLFPAISLSALGENAHVGVSS